MAHMSGLCTVRGAWRPGPVWCRWLWHACGSAPTPPGPSRRASRALSSVSWVWWLLAGRRTRARRTRADGRAPHALSRGRVRAAARDEGVGGPARRELDSHAKSPGHKGSCSRERWVGAIRVVCGRGGAGLQGCAKGREERTCPSKMPTKYLTPQASRGSADPLEPV
jgi:hypothetical protein